MDTLTVAVGSSHDRRFCAIVYHTASRVNRTATNLQPHIVSRSIGHCVRPYTFRLRDQTDFVDIRPQLRPQSEPLITALLMAWNECLLTWCCCFYPAQPRPPRQPRSVRRNRRRQARAAAAAAAANACSSTAVLNAHTTEHTTGDPRPFLPPLSSVSCYSGKSRARIIFFRYLQRVAQSCYLSVLTHAL